MTSEVCLMNRLGVVLAADSATTVKYWNGSAEEVRYFKGANKIFQLSANKPVGIMIYNSADALRVPWEMVIKEFRDVLADRSFNNVEGYADEFLNFINNDLRLFPADTRKAEFEELLGRTVLRLFIEFEEGRKAGGEVSFHQFLEGMMESLPIKQEGIKYDLENIQELRNIFGRKLLEIVGRWSEIFKTRLDLTDPPVVASEITDAEINYLLFLGLRDVPSGSPSTGLVFAGFGDHSVYPELLHLKNCQFWYDRFCESEREVDATGYEVPAVISGFAQTSMIDTLRLGFSTDLLDALSDALRAQLVQAIDEVQLHTGNPMADGEVQEVVRAGVGAVIDQLFQFAMAQHSLPLRRVVGVLPIDELSTLAETLIDLQSLKEKVTKPSETVGGPVDVASITRAEGLVWIKRKHYFDAELNSRYFERRSTK